MSTSLIPIKGISQALKKELSRRCKIKDIETLLKEGRTPQQRKSIADAIGIDRKYVDIWVKQADLWGICGMTEDFAYLLVMSGVRCAEDLAKIDVTITKSVLRSVSNTHPGYVYDEALIEQLKSAAKDLVNSVDRTDENRVTFSEDDPEPAFLYGCSGSNKDFGKIQVSVTLPDGHSYENTISFPYSYGGAGSVDSSQRPSGRIDHPGTKNDYEEAPSGRVDHSGAKSEYEERPSGRVDHPGMTGADSKKSESTSTTSGKSGSTGRRR